MKKLLLVLACGLLAGCDYTVPLATTPDTEMDGSVLGLWQRTTEEGKTEQLLVLPLDKHEYLVAYPAGTKDAMYARACLCHAGDKSLVQLKWFGTAEAELPDDGRVFQFLAYSLHDGRLSVRMLNSDVVSKETASSKELEKSITANRDKPDLFKKPMIFTKAEK